MLGADLVGFHTPTYLRHFATALTDILGLTVDIDRVQLPGREVRLGVFPMGIDAGSFQALAKDPAVEAEAEALRGDGSVRILVGVDRLDYTKGIPAPAPGLRADAARPIPSCGRRCGWCRWRFPPAPASRRTRISARWWTAWWAGSTARSARRAGCRCTTSSAASPRPTWWRSTAPPT